MDKSPVLRHFREVFQLSWSEYWHQWRVSACFVLALAAVLAPLMILFGLKFGVVSSMMEQLVEDPKNLEIRPVGSRDFTPDWFDQMRSDPDVGFLVPRTRLLAAGIKLATQQGGKIINAEMVPSAPGDPSLKPMRGAQPVNAPSALKEVVLSASVARKLELQAGSVVVGNLTRQFGGKRERVSLNLTVLGVAPERAFNRDGIFVSAVFMAAAEAYRDGRAVPVLNWDGEPSAASRARYPGFRLYARDLDSVLSLRQDMEDQGIEVRTHAADIEVVQSLDQNLSLVFWIIALVGVSGFSLSLGANLWADVDRKRRDLSVLRLVGFRAGDLVWFPVLQGVYTGLGGWVLALLIYLGLEAMINNLFSGKVKLGAEVCQLLPVHFFEALVLTLLTAILAAVLGGVRASRIEPSEGLRSD